MSNFKQVDYNKNSTANVKARVEKAQQQWLKEHLSYLQIVEYCNQIIKETFVCKKCGKRITNPNWVQMVDQHHPNDFSKIFYYHSKRSCNPHFNRECLYCEQNFRMKRESQRFCSKKCAVTFMNSPILLKRCRKCSNEFRTRVIPNKSNNESFCPDCH